MIAYRSYRAQAALKKKLGIPPIFPLPFPPSSGTSSRSQEPDWSGSEKTRSCCRTLWDQNLKSWANLQQLWSFLILCKILRHYKSLTPYNSMPQKRNQDFTERYPNIKAGTYKPMRIGDILTKNRFFAVRQSFRTRVRHIWRKIWQRNKNTHSCWHITTPFNQMIRNNQNSFLKFPPET